MVLIFLSIIYFFCTISYNKLSMFYNPFLNALFKYEKHINDFFVQVLIFVIVYLIDTFTVYNLSYNNLGVSFLAFVLCYVTARLIIRATGKKKHFGNFVNWSIHYCVFLGAFAWLPYFLFVRLQKFH